MGDGRRRGKNEKLLQLRKLYVSNGKKSPINAFYGVLP